MISRLGSKEPSIHPSAFVHPAAMAIGDVVIEEMANVWPGAVLRGDLERITVKRGASVQDGAVVHTDPGFPAEIGEGAIVGHGCVIHGCRIGGHSLIAMGAIILTGAEIGEYCIIGAGAVVPERKSVPRMSVVMGIPAKFVRMVEEKDKARIIENASAYMELVKKYRP